eukprot:4384531-Heterocapsa_arctica.AAC.1
MIALHSELLHATIDRPNTRGFHGGGPKPTLTQLVHTAISQVRQKTKLRTVEEGGERFAPRIRRVLFRPPPSP